MLGLRQESSKAIKVSLTQRLVKFLFKLCDFRPQVSSGVHRFACTNSSKDEYSKTTWQKLHVAALLFQRLTYSCRKPCYAAILSNLIIVHFTLFCTF
jgi:hypothetical protein